MPRKATDWERDVREIVQSFSNLLVESEHPRRGTVLADLLYRNSHTTRPDGYGTSSPGARSAPTEDPSDPRDKLHARSGAPTKPGPGYPGSPVEGTLMARQGTPEKDPVRIAVTGLLEAIMSARTAARTVSRRRVAVMGAGDHRRREDSPDFCRACHRPAHGSFRRGFCDTCRKAFDVWRNKAGNRTDDIGHDRIVFSLQHKFWEGHFEPACPQCVIDNYREAT